MSVCLLSVRRAAVAWAAVCLIGCQADRPSQNAIAAFTDKRQDHRSQPFLPRVDNAAEVVTLPTWDDKPVRDRAGLSRSYAEWMAEAGRVPEARTAYEQCLQENPEDAAAHLGLAKVDAAAGNAADAEAGFRKARQLAPGDAAVSAAWGAFELSRGRLDDADRLLSAAAAANPSDSATRHRLGILRARQGRTEEARRLFVGTVGPAGAAYSLGLLHKADRPQLAAAEFRRALQLRPGMEDARRELTGLSGIATRDAGLPAIRPVSHDR